jgi:hypothetical protein
MTYSVDSNTTLFGQLPPNLIGAAYVRFPLSGNNAPAGLFFFDEGSTGPTIRSVDANSDGIFVAGTFEGALVVGSNQDVLLPHSGFNSGGYFLSLSPSGSVQLSSTVTGDGLTMAGLEMIGDKGCFAGSLTPTGSGPPTVHLEQVQQASLGLDGEGATVGWLCCVSPADQALYVSGLGGTSPNDRVVVEATDSVGSVVHLAGTVDGGLGLDQVSGDGNLFVAAADIASQSSSVVRLEGPAGVEAGTLRVVAIDAGNAIIGGSFKGTVVIGGQNVDAKAANLFLGQASLP